MEKNTIFIITTSIILLILLILFAVKPSIIGYSVYQQVKGSNYSVEEYGKNIKELESQLLIANTNLSSCSEFNKKLLDELAKYSNKISEYKSDLDSLNINFTFSINKYEETIKNLIAEKEKQQEEINNLKSQYDTLAKNLANNLCCKARVDNPDIKYYKVEDNKIACVEEGILEISCII